jgi:hypothetical protein
MPLAHFPRSFSAVFGSFDARLRRMGCLLMIALVAACTTVSDRARPGLRPQFVVVELTSQITYVPFSTAELADPLYKAAIEQCEKEGFRNCRERRITADSRTQFSRTRDERVFAMLTPGGLQPERDYECGVRWIGPDGGVRARIARTFRTGAGIPRDFRYDCTFDWALRGTRSELGRWRAEIMVNGQVETDIPFEVID